MYFVPFITDAQAFNHYIGVCLVVVWKDIANIQPYEHWFVASAMISTELHTVCWKKVLCYSILKLTKNQSTTNLQQYFEQQYA